MLERSRAQELAAAIRDGERGGKARLEIVADGEEPPEMLQVRQGPNVPPGRRGGPERPWGWLCDIPHLFTRQVLGPKPTLQEGSPEEDIVADQRNAGAAVLYKARPLRDTTGAPGVDVATGQHGGHGAGHGRGHCGSPRG